MKQELAPRGVGIPVLQGREEVNMERTQERSRDKSPAFARKLRASKLARIERREARNQDVFDFLDSGV